MRMYTNAYMHEHIHKQMRTCIHTHLNLNLYPYIKPIPAAATRPNSGAQTLSTPSNPRGVFQRCLPNGKFRAGLPRSLG